MIENANAEAQEQAGFVRDFVADCERAHWTERYRKQYEAENAAGFYVVDAAKYDRMVEQEQARFKSTLFNLMTADAAREIAAHVLSNDAMIFSEN